TGTQQVLTGRPTQSMLQQGIADLTGNQALAENTKAGMELYSAVFVLWRGAPAARGGSAPNRRFGTENPTATGQWDPVSGQIWYNRAMIRTSAANAGRTWQTELYITAYHEHGHSLLYPLNRLVQRVLRLNTTPYWQFPMWRRAEEAVVEAYGILRAWLRKKP